MTCCPACYTPRPGIFRGTTRAGFLYECPVCGTGLLHAHGRVKIARSVPA